MSAMLRIRASVFILLVQNSFLVAAASGLWSAASLAADLQNFSTAGAESYLSTMLAAGGADSAEGVESTSLLEAELVVRIGIGCALVF